MKKILLWMKKQVRQRPELRFLRRKKMNKDKRNIKD